MPISSKKRKSSLAVNIESLQFYPPPGGGDQNPKYTVSNKTELMI